MEWPPSGTGWRMALQIARKYAWHFDPFSLCVLVYKPKNCSGLIAGAGFSTSWDRWLIPAVFLQKETVNEGKWLFVIQLVNGKENLLRLRQLLLSADEMIANHGAGSSQSGCNQKNSEGIGDGWNHIRHNRFSSLILFRIGWWVHSIIFKRGFQQILQHCNWKRVYCSNFVTVFTAAFEIG